jgi:biopolymer transport protein ExbD
MVIKNETLPALTLSQGKNYVCLKEDGTYVSNKFSPQYGAYNGTGVYFDIFSNKWYPSPSVINQDFNDGDTAGWTTGTAGALSIAGGELKLQHNGTNYPTISKNFSGFIVGKRYAVRVTLGCSDGVSTTPLLGFSGLSVPQSVFGIGKQYAVGIATATTVNIQLMAQTTTSGVFATMEDLVVYPINNDGSVDLSDVVETPSRNFLDAVVYADQNGQAVYVEQLSKTEYKDIIKANEFIGQNSIFALAVVDMTTTPPTLVKGYNVKSMLLTATGKIRLLYKKDAMDANYAVLTRMGNNSTSDVMGFEWYKNATVSGVEVGISNTANAVINANRVSIIILGGY